MRLGRLGQKFTHALLFGSELGGIEMPAHHLEAQVDEPGVEHVGLAVTADRLQVACRIGRPDLVSGKAELARQAE